MVLDAASRATDRTDLAWLSREGLEVGTGPCNMHAQPSSPHHVFDYHHQPLIPSPRSTSWSWVWQTCSCG